MVATLEKVVIDPYEAEKKVLWRLNMYWALCLVLCLALVAGCVWVIIYSGTMSMQAFEELPRYRTNRLLIDYGTEVKSFERSFNSTQGLVTGDQANQVLINANTLPELVLSGEKEFAATIALYKEITATIVNNTRGALEWNRYFQAQLDTLLADSEKRQQALTDILNSFPKPSAAETEAAENQDPEDNNK